MFETNPRPGSSPSSGITPFSAASSFSTVNRSDDSSRVAAAWSSPGLCPERTTKLSWWSRRRRRFGAARSKNQQHHNEDDFNPDEQALLGMMKRYSFQEIQSMTNCFSHVIGEGGFGTVHKGHLPNGSSVAVKRLKRLDFFIEFKVGIIAKHRNLISPSGYCATQVERILVFPYMARGTVEQHLRGNTRSSSTLDWSTRMRISVSIAKVLAYLHEDCCVKIIHRDVKSANVLLDENLDVTLADSGLAVLMDHKEKEIITGHVAGTAGYIDPEYMTTGKCSVKTDVYGYGVLVLEVVSGCRISDLSREACDYNVFEWLKKLLFDDKLSLVVDPLLEGKYVEEESVKMINLVIWCTQRSPCGRPAMSQVVRLLD